MTVFLFVVIKELHYIEATKGMDLNGHGFKPLGFGLKTIKEKACKYASCSAFLIRQSSIDLQL
jgi:hypothetical protein